MIEHYLCTAKNTGGLCITLAKFSEMAGYPVTLSVNSHREKKTV